VTCVRVFLNYNAERVPVSGFCGKLSVVEHGQRYI